MSHNAKSARLPAENRENAFFGHVRQGLPPGTPAPPVHLCANGLADRLMGPW